MEALFGFLIAMGAAALIYFFVALINHREGQKKPKFSSAIYTLEQRISMLHSGMTKQEIIDYLGKPTTILDWLNWKKEVGFKKNGWLKEGFFYELIRSCLVVDQYPIDSYKYYFDPTSEVLIYSIGYTSTQYGDPFAYRQTVTTSRGGVAVGIYLKFDRIDKIVINNKIVAQL